MNCVSHVSYILYKLKKTTYLPQAAEKSNWVLTISPDTMLMANIIVRGPFPLNAVQLIPNRLHGTELNEFADRRTASIARADSLGRINYIGSVQTKVHIQNFSVFNFFLYFT